MARKKTVVIVEEPTSSCKACRHGWFYEQEVWLCRRYPPAVIYDPEESAPSSSFPVVGPELVCGEFAAKLND